MGVYLTPAKYRLMEGTLGKEERVYTVYIQGYLAWWEIHPNYVSFV